MNDGERMASVDLLSAKDGSGAQAPITSSSASRSPSRTFARGVITRRMQKGVIAYHKGDYSIALAEFDKVATLSLAAGDTAMYLETCTYLLRILAEYEEFARIEGIEKTILKALESPEAAKLSSKLKSHALYVLGICNCYQENRHAQAMVRFRQAIDFAMIDEDRTTLAPPLYGAATVLYALQRYDDTLKELDRLGVLLSCLEVPDLKSAMHLLRALVRRNQGHYDEALESAWKAFESLKDHPQVVLYLHTLCAIGEIYTLKGDLKSARLYLDLASRSLKRDLKRVTRLITEAQNALGTVQTPESDLVFDSRTGLLWEKTKGEIHFEGQFILRDLLRVFLENQGRVFTKVELAERVWREPYNSKIHDNKIYVTIKRLRQLLEVDDSKANYILRAKTGYFLNPKIRVQMNEMKNEQQFAPAGSPAGNTEKVK